MEDRLFFMSKAVVILGKCTKGTHVDPKTRVGLINILLCCEVVVNSVVTDSTRVHLISENTLGGGRVACH